MAGREGMLESASALDRCIATHRKQSREANESLDEISEVSK